jgi:hypothetical protein
VNEQVDLDRAPARQFGPVVVGQLGVISCGGAIHMPSQTLRPANWLQATSFPPCRSPTSKPARVCLAVYALTRGRPPQGRMLATVAGGLASPLTRRSEFFLGANVTNRLSAEAPVAYFGMVRLCLSQWVLGSCTDKCSAIASRKPTITFIKRPSDWSATPAQSNSSNSLDTIRQQPKI